MSVNFEELYDSAGRVDLEAVADAIAEPIARLAKMTPLTAGALRKNPTSDRAQPAAQRFVRILSLLTELLGSRKASLIWLRSVHAELDGRSPLDLLYGQQFQAVEGLVRDLESRMPG